jgi:hypothetical protein
MSYHRTVCKVCGHNNDLRLIRRQLGKSYRCESCDYPYIVFLLDYGFIGLEKRNNRSKTFFYRKQLAEDFEYLDSLTRQKVKQSQKKVNIALIDNFIKDGKVRWVVKARSIFVQEAYMLGISLNTICKYFKNRGGKLDIRTAKAYINQPTT